MTKSEIIVGGVYEALVSKKLAPLRVEEVITPKGKPSSRGRRHTRYRCTNLRTGREVTIKSAAKFRRNVNQSPVREEEE